MAHLQIQNLSVTFGRGAGAVHAVRDISLEVPSGTVLGVVGESGSGKSTLARTVIGLQPASSGRILLDGEDLLNRRRADPIARAKDVQMIFQDPYSSLNPRMSVEDCLDEVLSIHTTKTRRERSSAIDELLGLVRLKPDTRALRPAQMSGGMRQRLAIARCLAVRPRFIIADEITSALDASVQGAVINLMRDLQAELELSMLFISHNLAVVRYIADQTAVMRAGRLVEVGESTRIVSAPAEEYTRELVAAIPTLSKAGTDPLRDEEIPVTRGLRVVRPRRRTR